MDYLLRPTNFNPCCVCVDCTAYFNQTYVRAGDKPFDVRPGHPHVDYVEPTASESAPEVPDLLVPIYDAPESADQIGRDGWYRHFSSLIENGEGVTSAVICQLGKKDVTQIRSEIVTGSPVTGTVTFRMVDDVLVAQLVSYTAFA